MHNFQDWEFKGFHAPRYTPTPDALFDELLKPGFLTEVELRVLLYIIRRTFGWKKDSDAISFSQFVNGIERADGTKVDYGAGVSHSNAVRAVKRLEAKGVIIMDRSKTKKRGFEATTYRLRMAEDTIVPNGTSLVSKKNKPYTTEPTDLVSESNRQETTVQETIKQEDITEITDISVMAPVPYDPIAAAELEDRLRKMQGLK